MKSLFDFADNGHSQTGFRLHALELYNWGTFRNRVWYIRPGGETALLTGENGSGKSTVICKKADLKLNELKLLNKVES